MTQTPIKRLFWFYTLPAVTSMLVSSCYVIFDVMFIGHYVGVEGLAAANLVWPVIGLVGGLGIMLGIGGSACSSVARGKGEDEKSRYIIDNSLTLLLISGLIITPAAMLFQKPIIAITGATEITLEYAQQYFSYLIMGCWIQAISATVFPV